MVMLSQIGGGGRMVIRWMQQINFGRLEATVRNGRIVADPAPRLFRSMRIGKGDSARRELMLDDFPLKKAHEEVLDHIARIQYGVIAIDIQHGLAVRITICEEAEDVIIAVDAVVVDGDGDGGSGGAMITCVSAPEDDGDDEDGACDVEGGITDRVDGDGGDGGDPVDDGDGASDANGGASDDEDETNMLTPRIEQDILVCARGMIGRAGITADDIEDVQQDLRLAILSAMRHYDPARSSPETYASRVIRSACVDIVRARHAQCRDTRREDYSMDAIEPESEASDTKMPSKDYRHDIDMAIDIRNAMADLSPSDLRVAEMMLDGSGPQEIAAETGVQRWRIYDAIDRIRALFLSRGLDAYI